jgi:hypothetical protein
MMKLILGEKYILRALGKEDYYHSIDWDHRVVGREYQFAIESGGCCWFHPQPPHLIPDDHMMNGRVAFVTEGLIMEPVNTPELIAYDETDQEE